MKKILILMLLFGGVLQAQEPENAFQKNGSVMSDQDAYGESSKKHTKALIIPFEKKMYISSVDREISLQTGLTFQEIRNNMRFAICNSIKLELEGKIPTISLMHLDTGNVEAELTYIYSSIGYKYEILPEEKEEKKEVKEIDEDATTFNKMKVKLNNFGVKVKQRLEKKEDETEQSAGVQNGEIVTTYDNKERFMSTSIHNVNLLSQLNQKFGADVFIFINQMDIESSGSDAYERSNGTYNRRIKVHYTIFDIDGKELYTGAAISYFPSKVNDMNRIIAGYFPLVSKSIASDVPNTRLNGAEQKKLKDDASNAEEQREEIGGY